MTPTLRSLLALIALTLLSCSTRLQAQVLLNGSFEDPALAANSFAAGAGADWTAIGKDFVISNDYSSLGNTPYGTQYLDLNQTGSAVTQTITGFVAGETYVLGLDFADIADAAGPQLTVSLTGAAAANKAFAAPAGGPYGTGDFSYTSATLFFTATTNGSATLTLTNTSAIPTGEFYPALAVDNIGLYGDVSTIDLPEPSTLLLSLLGLGVLLMGRPRRLVLS